MQTPGLIPLILPAHIVAGGLALVFGYVALYAAKGGLLHRRSGRLFFSAMVTMSLSGAIVAALEGVSVSVVAGLLTFYFVATGLLTVRPQNGPSRWIDRSAMLAALVLGLAAFGVGFDMLAGGRGDPEVAPLFIFGVVALLAAAGDLRTMRAGPLDGSRRLKRHLWRMCFAMWVAAASFFWGPPERVPDIIRIPALLPFPVLLPVAVMAYWLWRLRVRRSSRGVAGGDVASSGVLQGVLPQ